MATVICGNPGPARQPYEAVVPSADLPTRMLASCQALSFERPWGCSPISPNPPEALALYWNSSADLRASRVRHVPHQWRDNSRMLLTVAKLRRYSFEVVHFRPDGAA